MRTCAHTQTQAFDAIETIEDDAGSGHSDQEWIVAGNHVVSTLYSAIASNDSAAAAARDAAGGAAATATTLASAEAVDASIPSDSSAQQSAVALQDASEAASLVDEAALLQLTSGKLGVLSRLLLRWGDALTLLAKEFAISPLFDQANEKYALAQRYAKQLLTSETGTGLASPNSSSSSLLGRSNAASFASVARLVASPEQQQQQHEQPSQATSVMAASSPPKASFANAVPASSTSPVTFMLGAPPPPPPVNLQLHLLALRRCGSGLSRCAAVRVRSEGEYCSSLFSLSTQRFEEAQSAIFRYWPSLSPDARRARRNPSIGTPSPPQSAAINGNVTTAAPAAAPSSLQSSSELAPAVSTPERSPGRTNDTSSTDSSVDDGGSLQRSANQKEGAALLVPLLLDWGQALQRHAKVKEEIGEVRSALRVFQQATQKYSQASRADTTCVVALNKCVCHHHHCCCCRLGECRVRG